MLEALWEASATYIQLEKFSPYKAENCQFFHCDWFPFGRSLFRLNLKPHW